MLRKIFFITVFLLFIAPLVSAQDVFYKAKVEKILDEGIVQEYGFDNPYQKIQIEFLNGDMKGREIEMDYGRGHNLDKNQLVKLGETIVIVKTSDENNLPIFQITDHYRLDSLKFMGLVFFIFIVLLSGWKGLGSIAGMILSLIVITTFIVPKIIAGHDPLFISIAGCLFIMFTTIYLAHGFSKKTSIALLSTFLTLIATAFISWLFVKMTYLTGLGSDDAYSLKLGLTNTINFKGLLLGGMLIGTLGVLDDVTTSLSASIFELSKANGKLKFNELFASGMDIGREHISSLVNTLVLAYAGVSLPIFLIIVMNPNSIPLWVIINSEILTEEIVRTLAGSMGLVLAVPLTTALSAYIFSPKKINLP